MQNKKLVDTSASTSDHIYLIRGSDFPNIPLQPQSQTTFYGELEINIWLISSLLKYFKMLRMYFSTDAILPDFWFRLLWCVVND